MRCNLCDREIREEQALSVLQGEMVKCTKREGHYFHPFLEDEETPVEHYFHADCLSEFLDFSDSEDRAQSLSNKCTFCYESTVHMNEVIEITPIDVKRDHNDRPVIYLRRGRYDTVIRTYICWNCVVRYVGEGSAEEAFSRMYFQPCVAE